MRMSIATVLLLGCIVALAPAPVWAGPKRATRVVAKFGGECEGEPFRPSPRLKRMVERLRQKSDNPCDWSFCEDYAFRYDLDGDGRGEWFVRLHCGGTGNCTFGIFNDYPARSRGEIGAWFFYIHKRAGGWSALTTYERMGGDDGIVGRYVYRKGQYVMRFYRSDLGYYHNPHPFLGRMGVPKCE